MNIKLIIYIFSLFVILTPGFLMRTKETPLIHLIHALIFSIILYFTYNLVNGIYKENFGIKFDAYGARNLERIIGTLYQQDENPVRINLNNNFGPNQGMIQNETDFKMQCPAELNCSNPPTNAEKIVVDAYRTKYKRNPDIVGFNYWVDQVEKGLSEDELKKKLMYTLEYEELHMDSADNNYYNEQNQIIESNKCAADFNETYACCGQEGRIGSSKYICSEDTPICKNFIFPNTWGMCVSNGGQNGKIVEVIGDYKTNMDIEKQNEWLSPDGAGGLERRANAATAKFIWFTPNADKVTTANSNTTFEYKYYNKDRDPENNTYKLIIVCNQICYVYLNKKLIDPRKRVVIQTEKEKIHGPHRWPNVGVFDVKLLPKLNEFSFYTLTKDDELSLTTAGLMVSCIDTEGNMMFQTNSTWTYIDTLPPLNTDLMVYERESSSKKPSFFKPIVALYNKKYKGFLKGNADHRPINNSNPMKITLYKINEKRLTNALHNESLIFKIINRDSNSNKFTLFNYSHSRFLKAGELNGENSVTSTNIKYNQNFSSLEIEWEIVYNKDYTISFKSLYNNTFLAISDDSDIILKKMDIPDESCKWDICTMDSIFIGPSDKLTRDNGYKSKIPAYIKYIGNYNIDQMNIDSNEQPVWNDTFLTHDITLDSGDQNYNNFKINRIDVVNEDVNMTWGQKLYVCGINKEYYLPIEPTIAIETEGQLRELVIYDNLLIVLSKNDDTNVFYKSIYSKSTYISSWMQFTKKGFFNGLSIGKFDNTMAVMAIENTTRGPTLKYRHFGKFIDVFGWIETNYTNIKFAQYNFNKNFLYAINSSNQLFLLEKNGSKEEKNMNISLKYFKFNYLRNGEESLYGISTEGRLVYATLKDDGTLKSSEFLNETLSITKLDVYNNIIFALSDGKIYYRLAPKGNDFKLYISNNSKYLVDIYVYNDMIYTISNEGLVLSSPIIV